MLYLELGFFLYRVQLEHSNPPSLKLKGRRRVERNLIQTSIKYDTKHSGIHSFNKNEIIITII